MRHVIASLYKRNLGPLERAVTVQAFGYETRPVEIVSSAWSFPDAKQRVAFAERERAAKALRPDNVVAFPQEDDADRLLVTVVLSPTNDPRHPEAITVHSGLLSDIARDADDHERRLALTSESIPGGWFYCLSAENVGTTNISNVCLSLHTQAPDWLAHNEGRSTAISFGTVTLAPGETGTLRLAAPAHMQLRRIVVGTNLSPRPDGIMITKATWGDDTLLEDTAAGLFAADGETGSFRSYLVLPYEAVEVLKKLGQWNPEYPWDQLQVVKDGYHKAVRSLREGAAAELHLRNDFATKTVTVHAVAMVDLLDEPRKA